MYIVQKMLWISFFGTSTLLVWQFGNGMASGPNPIGC